MNKVNLRVEQIFSHAVALQQNGRLRSTVYCRRSFIYILNQDHTVLIRFLLRQNETPFKNPVSFEANDYDSNHFVEKNGMICFTKREGEYVREKSCRTPQFTPLHIHKLFKEKWTTRKMNNKVVLNDSFVRCLDESLSHIEFRGKKGKLIASQRNIYDGSVISIQKEDNNQFDMGIENKLEDFPPIGIRTNDFLALFVFTSSVSFYFVGKKTIWFENNDRKIPFVGMICLCMYNGLGGQ